MTTQYSPEQLPIVYHDNYVTPFPDGHRFPMQKFKQVFECIKESCSDHLFQVHRPEPASVSTLTQIHQVDYLESFQNGTLSDSSLREIGLPWSEGLVGRTIMAVGGTVKTVQLALEHGLACNTAGGTHHAFSKRGAGFCILNDLAIGAAYSLNKLSVDDVLIVDTDVHQGNGTARIFSDEPKVTTYSIHCADNYPFSPEDSDYDVLIPSGTNDSGYFERFRSTVNHALSRSNPDLVIYDAGVDVHREDRLGQLDLTDEGIARRDRYLLDQCLDSKVPVAAVIGGGYSDSVKQLGQRHSILHRSAIELLIEAGQRHTT